MVMTFLVIDLFFNLLHWLPPPKLTTPHPHKKTEFSPSGDARYKLPPKWSPTIFVFLPWGYTCTPWIRLRLHNGSKTILNHGGSHALSSTFGWTVAHRQPTRNTSWRMVDGKRTEHNDAVKDSPLLNNINSVCVLFYFFYFAVFIALLFV